MKCYCGSLKLAEECCLPFIEGSRLPETATQLMRSRYSAYVMANIEYLKNTTHSSLIKNFVEAEVLDWAKKNEWHRLEIISSTLGGIKQDRGEVEFKAHYLTNGKNHVHHENSIFVKESGKWLYFKGTINPKVIIDDSKTKRNDPCPCGSGLKFKKCCGDL